MKLPTTKQLEKLLKLRLEYETYKNQLLFEMYDSPIRQQMRRNFYLYPHGVAPLNALLRIVEEHQDV